MRVRWLVLLLPLVNMGGCPPQQPTYSCCDKDNDCTNDLTEDQCLGIGGTTIYNSMMCGPKTCPSAEMACCASDGTCNSVAKEGDCTSGSQLYKDKQCSSFTCPKVEMACCGSDGTCSTVNDVSECPVGLYKDETCSSFTCPQTQAACCAPDGLCIDITGRAMCAGDSQRYDGKTCSSFTCPVGQVTCCYLDTGDCKAVDTGKCYYWQGGKVIDASACVQGKCSTAEGRCTPSDPKKDDVVLVNYIFGQPPPQCNSRFHDVPVGNQIWHSNGLFLILATGTDLGSIFVVNAKSRSQEAVDGILNNSTFPCGAGSLGHTVCASPKQTFPPGDVLLVHGVFDQAIPLADPKYLYQLGFVFDADGVTTNNYQPVAQYPKDFFKDTDRWYEANYAPGSGWTLKVTDATGGTLKQVTSPARIILHQNVVTLVVPASEFAVPQPKFRVTAFRHTGDYCLGAVKDCSGDLVPAVDDGLYDWSAP